MKDLLRWIGRAFDQVGIGHSYQKSRNLCRGNCWNVALNMVVHRGGGEMMPKACASFCSKIDDNAPMDCNGARMQSCCAPNQC